MFRDFPDEKDKALSDLTIPVYIYDKKTEKKYWNSFPITDQDKQEIYKGQLTALQIYGDGELFEFSANYIQGIVFSKDSASAQKIVDIALEKLSLSNISLENVNFKRYSLNKEDNADPEEKDEKKEKNHTYWFDKALFKARIFLQDNLLGKNTGPKNVMVVKKQTSEKSDVNITNREALQLMTLFVTDLEDILTDKEVYGRDYVEKDGGLDRIKDLMYNIDLISRNFDEDFKEALKHRIRFNLIRIKHSGEINNIGRLWMTVDFMTCQLRQFTGILEISFPTEDKYIPKGDRYGEIVELYKEHGDKIRPINVFYTEVAQPQTDYQSLDISQEGQDNFQEVRIPWLATYYPEIVAELENWEPETAQRVRRNIIGIMKARQETFPKYMSKAYMDSIVYAAFMMILSELEEE